MDIVKRIADTKGIKAICAFLESPWFSIAFGVLTFFFYTLNIPIVTVGIFLACATFVFLFCEDTRPAVTLVLLLMFSFRYKDNPEIYYTKGAIKLYVVGGACFLLSALYRLVKRRVPFKSRFGLFSVGLFAAAILLGGIFTEHYTLNGFLIALGLAAALFGLYAFFAFTLQKREDSLLYLARVLAVGICLIALELLEFYLRYYTFDTPLDSRWKGFICLGWAIGNMSAEMLVFGLPAVFYLIYKEEKGYWYWSVVAVALFAVYFSFVRNAMLGAAATVFVGTLINCLFGKNRRINAILVFSALFVFIAVAMAMYKKGYLTGLTDFFFDTGFSDRGRFIVWEAHFELFKENPLFGVGFDAYSNIREGLSRAHNNVMQMLASTGLIGLGMYLLHRLQTIAMILKKPTVERILMGGCIAVSLLMGTFSSTFFHFYSMIFYSIILLVLEKSGERDKKKKEK